MSMEVDLEALDLGHLALFVGFAYADEVMKKLDDLGFGDLRFSHGFVFQHLLAGPQTIGELAERLQVTQQGASKSVRELEEMGYVERALDVSDARIRRVQLSARGRSAVEASRRARSTLEKKVEKQLGARGIAAARRSLAQVLGFFGGVEAVRTRRIVMPK